MKYISIILLMFAGAVNAGLATYGQIESSGTNSELWDVTPISADAVEVRGVVDGLSGYVVVGETIDISMFDAALFSIDVKNIDLNDTFDYFLYASVGSTVIMDGMATLAPGDGTTLTFSSANYASLTGSGDIAYGVGIYGGDDIFVTELSYLVVPEPVAVVSLAVGGLVFLRRFK